MRIRFSDSPSLYCQITKPAQYQAITNTWEHNMVLCSARISPIYHLKRRIYIRFEMCAKGREKLCDRRTDMLRWKTCCMRIHVCIDTIHFAVRAVPWDSATEWDAYVLVARGVCACVRVACVRRMGKKNWQVRGDLAKSADRNWLAVNAGQGPLHMHHVYILMVRWVLEKDFK